MPLHFISVAPPAQAQGGPTTCGHKRSPRGSEDLRVVRIDVNLPGWEFALATFVLPAATAQSHQSDHAGPGGKKQSEDQAQQIKPLARRVRHKRLGQGRA